MQANCSGNQYSFSLVLSDGVTPLPMTGFSSITVAISHPDFIRVDTSRPVTVVGSVASFTDALVPTSTFPVGGAYEIEFDVRYTGGGRALSRVYPLTILSSIV